MSLPADDDADNRARSIFDRLRAEQGTAATDVATPAEEPPHASEAAGETDAAIHGQPEQTVEPEAAVHAEPEAAFQAEPDATPVPEAAIAEPEADSGPDLPSPPEPDALVVPGPAADQTAGAPTEAPTGVAAGPAAEPEARSATDALPVPEGHDTPAAPAPTPTDPTPAPAAPQSREHDENGGEAPSVQPGPAAWEDPPVPGLPGEDDLPRVGAAPVPQRPARPLPRIIAVANQKGGVGKTTTAVNLGASLAELGHRVLVVDLDPQGNATTGLGINSRNLERSIYDVILHDTPIEDCIEPTSLRNLFVAPATIDLAGAEIELVPAFSRELRLRKALERVEDDFDFTLIDCPPSLGLLTINGLAAAHEVLVPIQCEYYALEGLGQLLRNVTLVQGNLNPRLEVSNIVLTMYDARTRLAEQVAQEVRDHFGHTVCRNVVPRTVRLSEAPSFGQPIIVFDPSSRGSIAYRELAKEVVGGTS